MARYTREEALEMILDEFDSGGELEIEEDVSFPLPHRGGDDEMEPSPSPPPFPLPSGPLSPSPPSPSQSGQSRSPSPDHSCRGRRGSSKEAGDERSGC